jgi:hypothetical protein
MMIVNIKNEFGERKNKKMRKYINISAEYASGIPG